MCSCKWSYKIAGLVDCRLVGNIVNLWSKAIKIILLYYMYSTISTIMGHPEGRV